jgi:hypothetical protein
VPAQVVSQAAVPSAAGPATPPQVSRSASTPALCARGAWRACDSGRSGAAADRDHESYPHESAGYADGAAQSGGKAQGQTGYDPDPPRPGRLRSRRRASPRPTKPTTLGRYPKELPLSLSSLVRKRGVDASRPFHTRLGQDIRVFSVKVRLRDSWATHRNRRKRVT